MSTGYAAFGLSGGNYADGNLANARKASSGAPAGGTEGVSEGITSGNILGQAADALIPDRTVAVSYTHLRAHET